MKINDLPVCVINLKERIERLNRTEKEFEKFGITSYTRIEGIREAPSHKGIAKSHINAIKLAKENKWPYVLVCEDDIYFQSERSREYADICFNNIPTDWNILLGGIYTTASEMKPYNNCWSKTLEFSALHFYVVNENCYDHIINNYDEVTHIDRWMANPRKGNLNCYVATPCFAIQYDGFSDNVNQETTYSNLFKDNRRIFILK